MPFSWRVTERWLPPEAEAASAGRASDETLSAVGTNVAKGDWLGSSGGVMIHTGQVLRSEDQTRNLNDQIAELQVRVAFPNHWSSGEHEQHVEKLRQLNFQKRLLADYGQK